MSLRRFIPTGFNERLVLCLIGITLVVFSVSYVKRSLNDARSSERKAERIRRAALREADEAGLLAAAESTKGAGTPEELKAIFAGFDEDTMTHVVHSDELRDAFRAWYAEDLGLALSMTEALPEKKRYFVFRWGEKFYQKDPEVFLTAARKYLDVSREEEVSLAIFKELGKTDAAKGLALLQGVKKDPVRRAVIPAFFSAWAGQDAEKAREGAAALEEQRERRSAEEAVGVR